MKYRSRYDIIASILQAAVEKGIRITNMMYVSFLSYKQLKHFLKPLVEHGLLEYTETQQTYRTTKMGIQYLEIYRQMRDLVKIE